MASDTPLQPLTIFLIKTGLKTFEEALDQPDNELTGYSLKSNLGFKGTIYLAPQQTSVPRWLEFLQAGAAKDLGNRINASTRAVLFIRASRRVFALTFGYGRALLKPEWLQRSFGLRVVVNTVDPSRLRSVDTKNVQELTVHTRRQTSRGSRFDEFGFDTQQDLVGALAGSPRDESLAKTVSGADALQIRSRIQIRELADKCRHVLRAYRGTNYKRQGFSFIDHVQDVHDPVVVGELNGILLDALATRKIDSIHLAPPQIIEWERVEGFSYTRGGESEADLDVESFLDGLRNPHTLSTDRLKRQRVFVHTGAPEPEPRWTVYNSLVAEFD